MPMTVATLRTYGSRRVAFATADGTFEGTIMQDRLSDAAVVVMLAPADGSADPLVIALDAVENVVER